MQSEFYWISLSTDDKIHTRHLSTSYIEQLSSSDYLSKSIFYSAKTKEAIPFQTKIVQVKKVEKTGEDNDLENFYVFIGNNNIEVNYYL